MEFEQEISNLNKKFEVLTSNGEDVPPPINKNPKSNFRNIPVKGTILSFFYILILASIIFNMVKTSNVMSTLCDLLKSSNKTNEK